MTWTLGKEQAIISDSPYHFIKLVSRGNNFFLFFCVSGINSKCSQYRNVHGYPVGATVGWCQPVPSKRGVCQFFGIGTQWLPCFIFGENSTSVEKVDKSNICRKIKSFGYILLDASNGKLDLFLSLDYLTSLNTAMYKTHYIALFNSMRFRQIIKKSGRPAFYIRGFCQLII